MDDTNNGNTGPQNAGDEKAFSRTPGVAIKTPEETRSAKQAARMQARAEAEQQAEEAAAQAKEVRDAQLEQSRQKRAAAAKQRRTAALDANGGARRAKEWEKRQQEMMDAIAKANGTAAAPAEEPQVTEEPDVGGVLRPGKEPVAGQASAEEDVATQAAASRGFTDRHLAILDEKNFPGYTRTAENGGYTFWLKPDVPGKAPHRKAFSVTPDGIEIYPFEKPEIDGHKPKWQIDMEHKKRVKQKTDDAVRTLLQLHGPELHTPNAPPEFEKNIRKTIEQMIRDKSLVNADGTIVTSVRLNGVDIGKPQPAAAPPPPRNSAPRQAAPMT